MDIKYGVGQWRPIHRFVVHQADGKVRVIDDGRRGGQNAASRMVETIRCISVDFVPTLCAAFERLVAWPYQANGWSDDWLETTMGTDDLPDAFRGVPLHPEDQRATVVSVWSPTSQAWEFVEMFGCPFGLGSVVLTFNRFPALMVAMTRRCIFFMHAA